jgi:hypothetical protein
LVFGEVRNPTGRHIREDHSQVNLMVDMHMFLFAIKSDVTSVTTAACSML